jgi:hypothetical protein
LTPFAVETALPRNIRFRPIADIVHRRQTAQMGEGSRVPQSNDESKELIVVRRRLFNFLILGFIIVY